MGTRPSYVIAYVDSFRSKTKIEKVGGNRVGVAVSSLSQLGLSEEKIISGILKIRSKTTNVAEIDVEKVKGVKPPGVVIKIAVRHGEIFLLRFFVCP